MPTKLRRVTLSLPPELDVALARFGRVTHGSQAKFIIECLQGNISIINGICDAVEAAQLGDVGKVDELFNSEVDRLRTDLDSFSGKGA